MFEYVVRKGGLKESEARWFFQQLIVGVDYLHRMGVASRDIKLENVMLNKAGDVKLMDFGLAKAIHGSPDKSLVITGTPLYMSPEQITGAEVDGRADIYSTGVMLFRLLSGRWPYYEGNILENHRSAPIPDPTAVNPGLPIGFKRFINRCMAKKAEERFKRATDVSKHLRMVFGSGRR